MPVCAPIKDMKDTAAFVRRIDEAADPVTVTRNGYDAFLVMRTGDYEALQEELAAARLMAGGRSSHGSHRTRRKRIRHWPVFQQQRFREGDKGEIWPIAI